MRESEHTSVTGETLYLRIWEPSAEPNGRVLLLVHGLGEHVGRYEHVARHFTAKGFHVYGLDHLGFGRSGGKKGDATVDIMARDIVSLSDRLDDEVGTGTERMLLGHSMGGLIALVALRDHPDHFRQAIVTGPALNVTRGVNPLLVGASRVLGKVLPRMTLASGLDATGLCTDPEVVRAYRADPLVHDRISTRLYNTMIDAGRSLRAQPLQLSQEASLLLMHGREDPICFADDTEALFESLQAGRKALKIWPDMRHEIHNEPGQEDVLDEMDRFLDA